MMVSGGCLLTRKAIPKLLDSPRMKSLLGSLPADAEREQLQATFLKRERQFHDLQKRDVQIRERCAEIARALPDATAKERTTLQHERRDLLAKQGALPADLTVGARLFAEVLSDWSAATFAAINQERVRVGTPLNASEHDFVEARFALGRFEPGTVSDAYDQAYATFRKIAEHRKPMIDRLDDLAHLEGLLTGFVKDALGANGERTRVKMVNGRPLDSYVNHFVSGVTKAAA